MTALSNAAETLVLQWLCNVGSPTRPTTPFVALGTGVSETALTGEFVGNGYARQSVAFSVSGDLASNTALLTFGPCTGTGWGTVSHFAIFDASTSGTMLVYGALASSVTIAVGDSLTIAISALTVTAA